MLPDWPEIKGEIRERLLRFLVRRQEHYIGPMKEMPRYRIFEGRQSDTVRDTGEIDSMIPKELQSEITYKTNEIPNLTFEDIARKFDKMAFEISEQLVTDIYKTIHVATEKSGNVIDGGGKMLDAEMILNAFERIEISFDALGNPKLPQLHVGPEAAKTLHDEVKRIESDPELRGRMRQIMQRKRDVYYAREADRKLVG